jgi:hypothetical protein
MDGRGTGFGCAESAHEEYSFTSRYHSFAIRNHVVFSTRLKYRRRSSEQQASASVIR